MSRQAKTGTWIFHGIVVVGGLVGVVYGIANPSDTVGGGLRQFPGWLLALVCGVLALAGIASMIRMSQGKGPIE